MYGYCSAELNLIWIKFYLKRNRSWAARHARPVPLREGRPRWPGREGRTRRKRRFRRRRIFFRRQRIFIRQRTRWQGSSHFFIPPTFHSFETENFTSVKPKTTIYANLCKFMQMSVFESVDTWLSTSSMFTFFHLKKKPKFHPSRTPGRRTCWWSAPSFEISALRTDFAAERLTGSSRT